MPLSKLLSGYKIIFFMIVHQRCQRCTVICSKIRARMLRNRNADEALIEAHVKDKIHLIYQEPEGVLKFPWYVVWVAVIWWGIG